VHQLGAQALGIAVAFGCVFVVSYIVFWAIKKTVGLRVSPEQEEAGLDIVEHGMYGYPELFIPEAEAAATFASSGSSAPALGVPRPATNET
jgi:Amt family ammonium transporter